MTADQLEVRCHGAQEKDFGAGIRPDLAPTDLFPSRSATSNKLKTKKTTLGDVDAFINAVKQPEKGVAGGMATLDADTARLPPEQLPRWLLPKRLS
jgi:hypothetical protein